MSINWTSLIKNYKGKWVALKNDEKTVVGYGKTLKQAASGALKKGYDSPIFSKIPAALNTYIG